jgi:hypothetical protein
MRPYSVSEDAESIYAISGISGTIVSHQEHAVYSGFQSADRAGFHPVESAETIRDHQADIGALAPASLPVARPVSWEELAAAVRASDMDDVVKARILALVLSIHPSIN